MPETTPTKSYTVVIIGCGWNGICVGGCLRQNKIDDFVILEKGDRCGSFWHEQYDSLRMHTPYHDLYNSPREISNKYPVFKSKNETVQYLTEYANHFGLLDHCAFNSEVLSMEYEGEIPETDSYFPDEPAKDLDYRYKVEVQENAPGKDPVKIVYKAKILLIATSKNRVPLNISFKNEENFKGAIIHGMEFKNGKPFTGKKVLLIGSGNSAFEFALDLHKHNAEVIDLLIRSPRHTVSMFRWRIFVMLFARFFKSTRENDFRYCAHDKEFHQRLKRDFPAWVLSDMSRFGVNTPKESVPQAAHYKDKAPTFDWGAANLLSSGRLKVITSGIQQFTENGVELEDGSFKDYDVVIKATGYQNGLRALLPQADQLLTSKTPESFPFREYQRERPATDGRCRSTRVDTLYFPGFDLGVSGGLSMGIYAWHVGERVSIQLGKLAKEDASTFKIKERKEEKSSGVLLAMVLMVILLVCYCVLML